MPFTTGPMPIRPENQKRYPKNWKQISERIRERAGHKCEGCGLDNYATIDRGGGRTVKIVLTVAHLNHQPEDCADDNLRCWCQKCHNSYDAPMRARGIKDRRRKLAAVGDLFG